jgi:uncharacterized membrane protein
MLAAIQAPVIMMSQNRQDTKDRLRGELDFAVNRRAEAEVQSLSRKLNVLIEKIVDVRSSFDAAARHEPSREGRGQPRSLRWVIDVTASRLSPRDSWTSGNDNAKSRA